MTYEDFYKIIEAKCDLYHVNEHGQLDWKEQSAPAHLYKKWSIGGQTGGSCWGDRPSQANAESEPDFEGLTDALAALGLDLKLSEYKKLCENCIDKKEYTESGYYGNYYDYAVHFVNLRILHLFLTSHNLIK